jgi:molecular chaperone DnaJ
VQPHKLFQREGDDIIYILPVNFAQVALGAEVQVPTLDGDFTLKIPPGTQSGEAFRIRGRGVPHFRGRGRGDQIVQVYVVTPQSLDERQRELLQELAESLGPATMPQPNHDRGKGFFKKVKDTFSKG